MLLLENVRGNEAFGSWSQNPNPHRLASLLSGGKDFFAADKAATRALERVYPGYDKRIHEQRHFQRRIVDHLVREKQVRQLVVLGAGYPEVEGACEPTNVHEVAASINPKTRTAYVADDFVVFMHLQTHTASDDTLAIHADVRTPLFLDALRGFIDFALPVGVILVDVFDFLTDEQVYDVLTGVAAAMTGGGFVAISSASEHLADVASYYRDELHTPMFVRTEDQVRGLLPARLNLVAPGIVPRADWDTQLSESGPNEPRYYALASV